MSLVLAFAYYIHTEKNMDRLNEKRVKSYQLADDLKILSDEKTRMARSFVVTLEDSYQQQFKKIIAIQNGVQVNPDHENMTYFDAEANQLRAIPAAPIALMILFKMNGYSEGEINAFARAEALFNALTDTEKEAMAIASAHNKFDVERAQAIGMLFDANYNRIKADIKKHIDLATQMLHQRIEQEVKIAEDKALFARLAVIFLGLIFLILAGRLFVSWRENERYYQLYAKLAATQSKLNAFMENNPAIVWIKHADGRLEYINKMFEKRFGIGVQDWKNKTDEEIWPTHIAKALRENDLQVLTSEKIIVLEEQVIDADQHETIWHVTKFPIQDEKGNRFVAGIGLDITELKHIHSQLVEARSNLQLLIDHAPAALAMFDNNMCYLAVSRRWLQEYQLQDQKIIGDCHYDVFPEITLRWKELHKKGLAGEVLHCEEDLFIREDGRQQWVTWEIRPWHTNKGNIGGIVIFSEDITPVVQAKKALESLNQQLEQEKCKLEYMSSHDPLTGLYNRGLMDKFLKSEFSLVKRNHRSVCLMMLDIDFFKKINDQYGHAVGDQVLAQVAKSIKERLRTTDIAFRYGGEEFLILLPDTQIDQAVTLAKDINSRIGKTPLPSLNNNHITVSIGVTSIAKLDVTYEAAVLRADAALYQSKEANRNCVTVLNAPHQD